MREDFTERLLQRDTKVDAVVDSKMITIYLAGSTRSVHFQLFPGDSAESVMEWAAPKLEIPFLYKNQLFGSDGNEITGDVYKATNKGDNLTLVYGGVE